MDDRPDTSACPMTGEPVVHAMTTTAKPTSRRTATPSRPPPDPRSTAPAPDSNANNSDPSLPVIQWTRESHYLECKGRECTITITKRPPYCDRGNYLAQIFPTGVLARDLDHQDGWPRYFFHLEFAQREVEAWLRKRKQAR